MIGSNQGTVAGTIHLHGVGVHSGKEATLEIKPAKAGTGVRFRRIDLPESPEIPADLDHVADTELGTSLAGDDIRVLTVEHVLAALAATGVSNALIELDGPEPPILDGSFLPYVEAIEAVGVVRQDGEVPVVRIQRPISVDDGKGSSYLVAPARSGELRISATIDFAHPAIGRQYGSFDVNEANFRGQLAPARTFGFRGEAEALRERGLARGSSLENTIVLDDEGVMNDGLRFPDECLRHKVGDVVGDLALLGCRVEAHVVAERPSHHGNVALARAIEEARREGEGEGIPIVDIQKILQYLPHRYPMLLVDRVTHFESGKRIVGIKNVTINEPFFQGHYPGHPIMPGVLIIEAMAQVGGLLLMDTIESPEDKVVYFMSLDKVKWRRPVTPGDQVVFRVELVQLRRSICRMRGEGFVDGKLVAEAELMARMVDR